ncbi:MAG: alpha/beta hydrolase [Ktedonobacteraceae bacterium]|nr:alpha/beta hydrolase [Ktedonobacteraceae bacterium]
MLYTYESGVPTAPAIVFLHGGGLSGRMWQPQMERLPDYYCLAPDLPEQGKSFEAGAFRLEDAARQVISLIDERVPGKRVHLVGISLGAAVALAIMHIVPAYVDHALVSGTAPLGKGYGKFVLSLIPLIKFMNIDKQIKASYKQFGVPEAYQPMFHDDLLLTTTAPFTRHSVEALMELPQFMPCESSVPTLAAVGGQENRIAKGGAKKIAGCLKRSQVIVVPGVGHVWNLQAPELFTDIMRAWIEDRPLPDMSQRPA